MDFTLLDTLNTFRMYGTSARPSISSKQVRTFTISLGGTKRQSAGVWHRGTGVTNKYCNNEQPLQPSK